MILVLAVATAALLLLPATAMADDEEIYRSDVVISNNFVPPPHWVGTVTGDITGSVEYWPVPANSYVVGSVKHFYENFTITTSVGIIKGYDIGVWNFSTFKFRAEGWVTSATGEWAGLVGYKYHEMGYTTPLSPPTPIVGTGTMFIAAP